MSEVVDDSVSDIELWLSTFPLITLTPWALQRRDFFRLLEAALGIKRVPILGTSNQRSPSQRDRLE